MTEGARGNLTPILCHHIVGVLGPAASLILDSASSVQAACFD